MSYDAEEIAQVCHEANRALQLINNDPAVPVAPRWLDVTPEMRESAIEGVEHALDGATPEQMHQGWCDFKTARGWKYGPVKDEKKKEHPCLVPYDQLSEGDRVKDALFSAIVFVLSDFD